MSTIVQNQQNPVHVEIHAYLPADVDPELITAAIKALGGLHVHLEVLGDRPKAPPSSALAYYEDGAGHWAAVTEGGNDDTLALSTGGRPDFNAKEALTFVNKFRTAAEFLEMRERGQTGLRAMTATTK